MTEAKIALEHLDRAVNLSRASSEHAELTIHIGKSPYTDPYLITKLLSLRLPMFPQLQISLTSRLSGELMHELLNGTLDLAFLTGVPETPRLSGSIVADQSFWVAMPETESLADCEQVMPEDLRSRSCILFDRHVQPNLYDNFLRVVRPATERGRTLHHVMTAEDAIQLIMQGFGVAVLSQSGAWRILRSGITIRPLKLDSLRLETRLVARSDNDSRVVSDLVRSFARSLSSTPTRQFHFPLSR